MGLCEETGENLYNRPMTKKAVLRVCDLLTFLLYAGALGLLFGPILETSTLAQETISFPGLWVFFGATPEIVLPSGLYAFSFRLNPGLLIGGMALILALISALIDWGSRWNKLITTGLALVSFGILLFLRPLAVSSSSLVMDGLRLGPCSIFSLVLLGLAIALSFTAFLVLRRKKNRC